MKSQNKYKVIGLMSGTSLDGLDLAYTELSLTGKKWSFKILSALTKKYNQHWRNLLTTAHTLPAPDLLALDVAYGNYLGQCCLDFMAGHQIKKVDLIASHGHTIFHQPEKGFTFQLGNGNALHGTTGLPVVFDFRSLDVVRGGEGAPLVPIGDRHLFSQYEVCLNLGGIANLSLEQKGKRMAYDFCFANMGLNYLATKAGKEYDKDGELAARGTVDVDLLKRLEDVYKPLRTKRPSLGREGFEKLIQPILDQETISVENRMRTFCESIAIEVSMAIPVQKKKVKLLATGGGALNSFLVQLLMEKLKNQIEVIIPDRQIIEFKEALVFALIGALRIRGEVNCLKSVTDAKSDSCAGLMIGFR